MSRSFEKSQPTRLQELLNAMPIQEALAKWQKEEFGTKGGSDPEAEQRHFSID